MVDRFRVASALVLGSCFGYWACRGDNYVVIPHDAGAGSAVAAWADGQDPNALNGSSGNGGSGSRSSSNASDGVDAALAADAAAEKVPCLNDGDCVDLNACNGVEACKDGFCAPGTPVPCNDGNSCTRDTCDPATGACTFTTEANGVPCGAANRCDGQVCLEGVCTPGPAPVCAQAGNPCSQSVCDPATGACVVSRLPDGAACDDADLCNGRETCVAEQCRPGLAPNCNDGNVCTVDSCDPVVGCINAVLNDGTSCSDGNVCNGTEICIGGTCRPGTPLTCNDHSPCTVDSCNPLTGACSFTPIPDGTPCPDGNLCDGQTCRAGACVDGPPVVCAHDNDNNPCTGTVCQAATGTCVETALPNGTPCPDGDFCNGTETCIGGTCSAPGTPLLCPDDGNPCTSEICAPISGCLRLNVPDGTACADANVCDGTETCTAGVCSSTGVPLNCDDGNPCTADACNPGTGCTHTLVADGTSCADANHCNGTEVCGGGVCLQGTAINCNDNNPCTTDSCAPATGACSHVAVPDGTTCPDANACDGTETCTAGVCSSSGVPLSCDDGNPCTTDGCNPGSGTCTHAPVLDGTSCADANLCNGAEFCGSGVCLQGVAVTCTSPAVCNPSTGTCQ